MPLSDGVYCLIGLTNSIDNPCVDCLCFALTGEANATDA
jgi:hypothetical protein